MKKKKRNSFQLKIGRFRIRTTNEGKDHHFVQEFELLNSIATKKPELVENFKTYLAKETNYNVMVVRLSKPDNAPEDYPEPENEFGIYVHVPIPKMVDLKDSEFLKQMGLQISTDISKAMSLM